MWEEGFGFPESTVAQTFVQLGRHLAGPLDSRGHVSSPSSHSAA